MKTVFERRMFRYMSLFIVAFTVLFALVLFYTTYSNIRSESQQSLQQLTARTGTELDALLGDMDKLALYISTSPYVTDAFKNARINDVSNATITASLIEVLTSITIPNNASRYRINLYNEKGNFITAGIPIQRARVSSHLGSEDYVQWYNDLPLIHNHNSITLPREDTWSGSPLLYISLYREIFDPMMISEVNGVMEIQCPFYLVERILSFETDDYGGLIFDANGEVFYASGPEVKDAAHLLETKEKRASINTPIFSTESVGNGWTLMLVQTSKHINQVLVSMMLMVLVGFAAIVAVSLMAAYFITRQTAEPLRVFTASIKNITLESPYLDVDLAPYSDEFAGMSGAFDSMMQRLTHSMEENVRHKAMEMRANMIALQSQMDPHFLFNTLTIIKTMSKAGNNERIADVCDYMAQMLRYISTYREEMVSLRAELEHTENYLKLMKLRFESQFGYQIQVSPEIEADMPLVPRLFLQPLVENCFQHAFKKAMPPWHIHIEAWVDADWWTVRVTDNGFSITQEALQALHEQILGFSSDPSEIVAAMRLGGMGLINTVARLRLGYKEDARFEIEPLADGGTSVTLGGRRMQ